MILVLKATAIFLALNLASINRYDSLAVMLIEKTTKILEIMSWYTVSGSP